MKKYCIILLLIMSLCISGCSETSLLTKKKEKTSVKHYTERLTHSFSSGSCKVRMLSTDFYRSVPLDQGSTMTIQKFFKYVPTTNFDVKPDLSKLVPKYKLFIDFDTKDKYVINVYNESLITVFPWDGIYDADCISMQNTYTSYNLFYLCEYIMKNVK